MSIMNANPRTMPGLGDCEPSEDRVTCWACDGLFPSDLMVDGYVHGPVCERCWEEMAAEAAEEEERLDKLEDIQ